MTDTIYVLSVLYAVVAIGEWLGRTPAGRWRGGAMASYRHEQGMN